MFYEPALAILKSEGGRPLRASEVKQRILTEYPDLEWGGTQGPVRAMLLKAAEQGTPIKQVPDSKPPRFYYDESGSSEYAIPPEPSDEEALETAFQKLHSELKLKLLERLRDMEDDDFEVVVNRLVSRLGFGEAVTTKKNNDRGIDGYIFADRLGLNVICVQAKRYQDGQNVQRPAIDAFIGALEGRNGVFVTSSGFSPGARQKAEKTGSNSKIALIDGKQLVEYMIEFNLGVQDTGRVYTLKKIDEDFFADFG
jgi:restriction system protein